MFTGERAFVRQGHEDHQLHGLALPLQNEVVLAW